MATVTLRFYGRFVMARKGMGGGAAGEATFLAVKYTGSHHKHHVLMSVPRNRVVLDPSKTALAPAERLMAAGDPAVCEHMVWDLHGHNVMTAARGGVTMGGSPDGSVIMDLRDLEKKQKRDAVLDQRNLRAGELVSAAINIAGGTITYRQAFAEATNFVPLDKKTPVVIQLQKLADVIDVTVTLPAKEQTLEIGLAKGKRPSPITIQTLTADGTPSPDGTAIVTFTNLCSRVPVFEQFDLEFGQYYELLKDAKRGARMNPRKDRLIPQPIPHHGGGGDCNDPASIDF